MLFLCPLCCHAYPSTSVGSIAGLYLSLPMIIVFISCVPFVSLWLVLLNSLSQASVTVTAESMKGPVEFMAAFHTDGLSPASETDGAIRVVAASRLLSDLYIRSHAEEAG